MVFEGKPLAEPSSSTTGHEVKPTTPKVEAPITPPPEEPKKKTHKFRNFVLSTVLLGSLAYGGAAYYSLQNDDVHDFFVDRVPLGSEIMDFILSKEFHKLNDFGKVTSGVTKPTTSELETIKVEKSGATWKAVSEPAAVDIIKPGPHLSAKPKPGKQLPLLKAPKEAGATVQQSIDVLNEFIQSINESKQSADQVDKISKQIEKLAANISEIKASFSKEITRQVQENVANATSPVANAAEISDAIEKQKAEWMAEFNEEQKRLQSSYNDRLQNEIQAAQKVIFSHAKNQLIAVNSEREKQFADEVQSRVEKERDGRLAGLEELQASLKDIEKLTIEADAAIEQADRSAQLHIAIGSLRTALQSERPVALRPYIEAVRAVANDDPLLIAALDSVPHDVYDQGVLTRQQLAARFHLLQNEIRKVSLLPHNAGIAGHVGSLIFSNLLWTKKGSPSGDDVESVLARTNYALTTGNIVDAVGEVNSLSEVPKRLAGDWLAQGRNRCAVEFLVEVMAEEGKLWNVQN